MEMTEAGLLKLKNGLNNRQTPRTTDHLFSSWPEGEIWSGVTNKQNDQLSIKTPLPMILGCIPRKSPQPCNRHLAETGSARCFIEAHLAAYFSKACDQEVVDYTENAICKPAGPSWVCGL